MLKFTRVGTLIAEQKNTTNPPIIPLWKRGISNAGGMIKFSIVFPILSPSISMLGDLFIFGGRVALPFCVFVNEKKKKSS